VRLCVGHFVLTNFDSGSMRLAKDMYLFTKKNDELTVIMLSRRFLEAENITGVSLACVLIF
jgi:hypothetical protein